MLRLLTRLLVLGLLAAGVVLWYTRAQPVDAERFASLQGDATRGESTFWAAGCSSCHKAKDSETPLVLAGGQQFVTDFGTFTAPNVSPDPIHGIGEWSLTDFASAVLNGTSPEGRHYFPAFPYTTYARMTDADLADLWAFWQTLPSSDTPSQPHDVGFPFNIRASLGPWKMLFLNNDWVAPADTAELRTRPLPGRSPWPLRRMPYLAQPDRRLADLELDGRGAQPFGPGPHPRHFARAPGLERGRHRLLP